MDVVLDQGTGKAPRFYAPQFRFRIGGKELHEEAGDVLSVQFKDSIKDLAAVELVLNNVRHTSRSESPTYKYSDGGDPIDLGKQFELEMGYADAPKMQRMLQGEVIAFDPQFPPTGSSTLVVRGLDLLHRLRNQPKTKSWEKKTDAEIAGEIARENGFGALIDSTKERHDVVPQDNKDDISFLLERAKRLDFEVFLRDGDLHFVHTREGNSPVLTLEYGKSLMSFAPSLTLARQVSKVTVRCWHPIEGRLIEKSATRAKLNDLKQKGKNAGEVLESAFGKGKEEVILKEAVLSDEEAQTLAESVLRRNAHSFVTGSGQTVGIPSLRAGVNIELKGLGKRFDGAYYVTESTHRIDQSGYQTTFSVRKAYA
ncbi:MAG: hypothetical protein RMA76_18965 [Deltaproteobacteria bacterium]|jgi:phage protein D